MYKKFILFWLLYNIFIFLQPSFALAKTYDEYISEAAYYYKKGEYEKAISILEEGVNLYPDSPEIHYGLVDSYNELGQKHYFPKELCLRIIYHTERFLELNPNPDKKDEIMEFLRKSIGHYDVASMGIVKVVEIGGDGAEFQLLPDNIGLEEKLSYKKKAEERLKEYDKITKEALYKTEASDKTPDEILDFLNAPANRIKTVYFKKINRYGGLEPLLEVFYKHPDKFKVVEQGSIGIVDNNIYYVIDEKTNKIINEGTINLSEMEPLQGLHFFNFSQIQKHFDLRLERIKACPTSLKSLYENMNVSLPNLYLLTAKLKSGEKKSWPPIIKLEYYVDLDFNLVVAKKEYWRGILGSGREEELAREDIVTRLKLYEGNLYLPVEGITRGYTEELANLKEDWQIEILSLNKGINDLEFNVNKYSR